MSVNRARECIVRMTQLPTTHIRDRMKLRAWQPSPVFSPGESCGQRSLAGYGSWGCRELDRTEVSEYACMKLRADPTAKQCRINTKEAGGLEQRETEKHEPQPENKAKENATKHTGRVIDFDGSRGHFSHLQMSGGALRCGDSLKLTSSLLLGVFTKPSISAHPSPLVGAGENVTLRCHSPLLDKFILHQENSTGHFQRRGEMLTRGHAPADFVIGPMTLASAGTYRCYGSLRHSPYEWSAPSDPVDIVITGLSKKPSLSAQGGPVVRSGENVTLVCSSESAFDQFHLLRDGENLECPLAGGQSPHGALQAEFPLGPGTPAHSGVYRCYGSFTHSPYSWSDSSDPLFLSVTGSTTSTCPSTMDPHTTEEALLPQKHSSTWYIFLGLGLVIAFTSTSIILAALVCYWSSTQNHVANMEGEPNEGQTVNGEDPAAEDVIYAHLNLGTLSERLFTPAPLSHMHPFTEPIIYEEFNVNQDHAEP
uniref:Putative killer cell immunoglobulin-like receptor like protein KIR3DP1 n=1 Tax=Bos indicus x Bos taurus TaxID=30522 RepID=A0A4W2I8E0_BOBOX